ncbi:MAG: hypothetical protein WBD40_06855 [Tepidisphaeraceae bacterium]
MSLKTILLASIVLLLAAPIQAFARDALVGTWKIKVTPDDDARKAGEKEIEDKVTFKGSKFVSETWKKKHKFDAADYEEDSRAGLVAQFKSNPVSKTGGKMEWSGTATGSAIKGEITWTKPDGTVLKYTFEGEKE